MAKRNSNGNAVALSGCGCWLVVVLVNLTLGAWCFNYCLGIIWGTQLPLGLAMIGGLFLGPVAIPAAVICWLIQLSGVPTPFF
jgi:hypothetical protein